MFSFEKLSFCIKTIFYCSQMNGYHSWSMLLSGETQLPLLLCYILLFYLCVFFLPPSYFLLPLYCCAVLINVHTPPLSRCLCTTHIHSCCWYFLSIPFSLLLSYLMGLSINWILYSHHFLLLFCLCVHFPVILYSIPSASLPALVILWGSLSPSYPHPSSP